MNASDRFLKMFRERLRVDHPLPLPSGLRAFRDYPDLVHSRSMTAPCLVEVDVALCAPPGAFMTGFYGYGMNSYAFYRVESTTRVSAFLRLPYGGAYMDDEKERANIVASLNAYRELVEAPDVKAVIVALSMGANGAGTCDQDGQWAFAETIGDSSECLMAVQHATRQRYETEDQLSRACPDVIRAGIVWHSDTAKLWAVKE